ncbi:MAG: DUF4159 domain-containing protein [bacterium]|nr:DUF4159 domain-containing protein [bacterium]
MYLIVVFCFISYNITLARVKYSGGGDWYNDPSMLPNLAHEINKRTTIRVDPEQHIVSLSDVELFNYPFIFITGHGNIKLSDSEVKQLREYLTKGGFLYADDDYGMDEYFRREIGKVFPGIKLEELPFKHPIYHSFYDFDYLPKIHKHDDKPPKGYGIFYQGRLVVFYTYETNISDGWADPWVHNDPAEKREEAFKMGVNILMYAILHNE